MDLSTIKEANTAEYEILHPVDKTRLGVVLTLAGPEHPKRHALATRYSRHLRQRVNRVGKITLEDPDTEQERETDFLVTCTLDWKDLSLNGQPVPYSPEAARKLYDDSEYAWLRRQVQEALNAQENFIVSSSRN